jgi:hypothetical protein
MALVIHGLDGVDDARLAGLFLEAIPILAAVAAEPPEGRFQE